MTAAAPTGSSAAVDLWVFPLDACCRLIELEAFLAHDERARADRFVYAADRTRFVTGRGLLRVVLAHYCAAAPSALAIAAGPNGKPVLEAHGAAPHFNLSHSGDFAALAVSRNCEVGIDIEQVRPIEPGFAERFFSRAEIAGLAALPEADRLEGLFRCWSRKEAVLKAKGVGLLGEFRSFDVSVAAACAPAVTGLPGPWSLAAFTPADGYVGALAARAASMAIRRRALSEVWSAHEGA